MDSIYFEDPLGLLVELASYRFEPPHGFTHADVLMEAHSIRVARGDYNIAEVHLADAIQTLVERSRATLSTTARRRTHTETPNPREETWPRPRPKLHETTAKKAPQSLPRRASRQIRRASRSHEGGKKPAKKPALHLNMLKPSVNNMRCASSCAPPAGFRGERCLGLHALARIPCQEPGAPDADAGGQGPAQRRAVGELRHHAVSLQQAWAGEILPEGAGQAGDDRQRHVLPDRHALSLLARATYPRAWLPAICRRGRGQRRRAGPRRRAAQKAAMPRSPSRSTCSTHFS